MVQEYEKVRSVGFNPIYKRVVYEYKHAKLGRVIIAKGLAIKVIDTADGAKDDAEDQWEVENVGIAPDVDVDLDPKAWRAGHDTQLEKGVELALEALAKNPPQAHPHPPYPNYHRK